MNWLEQTKPQITCSDTRTLDKMDRRYLNVFIFLAVCGNFRRKLSVAGDSFASIAQLEKIVNLEIQLGESLERFLEQENKRLQEIKQFAKRVKEATELVKKDGMKVLENPTATYAVIKRFANGWTELAGFLSKDYSQSK